MNAHRPSVDRVFAILIIAELIFGLVMLTSASGPLAFLRFHSSWYYARHQLLFGVLPGLVCMYILSRIDYHVWEKRSAQLLMAGLLLMVLVFIPGLSASYGAAHSWIVIGGKMSFQPTEIIKLLFVIYLAALFSTRRMAGARREETHAALMPALGALAIISVLLILQPDVGSLMLMVGTFFVMMFAAGAPLIYVFGAIFGVALAIFALIKTTPYRAARLMVFLHPELDPQGIGYQINQALLAIGSGGLFGLGLGHSRQKFSYLPEVMSDSIFPIIAEEVGFIFTLALLIVIAAIFFRGYKISKQAPDPFGRLLSLGIISSLTIQAFLNIGAMLGLVPLTGLPLPFISYGGTAMVVSLSAVGIMLNISRGSSPRA